MLHNHRCFASHLGPWAINGDWMNQAVEAIRNGTWKAVAIAPDAPNEAPSYQNTDGVALIPVSGPIMRGQSKYGGASSLGIRQGIRAALNDPKVSAIMLAVDSPGGTVTGTDELAQEVKAATAKKPVYAHVEGQAASAAYWAIAYATRITASPTSLVGSIGVFAVLEDTTKAADAQGVRVHVVKSGEMKGAGEPGTPITQGVLDETKRIVDGMAEFFFQAVKEGRGLDAKGLNAVNDGNAWLASEAKKLGLVDAVQTMDASMIQVREKIAKKAARKARADAEIRLAGM